LVLLQLSGFEDGIANIYCPASSIFSADQDCLYFADCEKHAIRKADMEKRTVQTLHPPSDIKQGFDIWEFINRWSKDFEAPFENWGDFIFSVFKPWLSWIALLVVM
jgi:hypothetical protein